jgi:hypothetical protein
MKPSEAAAAAVRREAALVMEAYNRALSDSLDGILASVEDDEELADPGFEQRLRNGAQNDLQVWFDTPLDGLLGRTPAEALDAVGTLGDAMLWFEQAAVHCDDEIPDLLRLKLGCFGSDATDALMTLALAPSWETRRGDGERPPELQAAGRALELLGEWQAREALEMVAAKFSCLEEPEEGMAEAFRTYCKAIGPDAARELAGLVEAAALGDGELLKGPIDYMAIAIADIGRDHREERLFHCLRTAFRRMEHKAVGAICLGDYGDGRAVPTLKGFLDRYEGRIDRQTFYEVMNAIRRLGGVVSDIRNPFAGDFGRPH